MHIRLVDFTMKVTYGSSDYIDELEVLLSYFSWGSSDTCLIHLWLALIVSLISFLFLLSLNYSSVYIGANCTWNIFFLSLYDDFSQNLFPSIRFRLNQEVGKLMLLFKQFTSLLLFLKHFNARLNFALSYTLFARGALLLYCILIKFIIQKLRL